MKYVFKCKYDNELLNFYSAFVKKVLISNFLSNYFAVLYMQVFCVANRNTHKHTHTHTHTHTHMHTRTSDAHAWGNLQFLHLV
jgi:hypothetical protein